MVVVEQQQGKLVTTRSVEITHLSQVSLSCLALNSSLPSSLISTSTLIHSLILTSIHHPHTANHLNSISSFNLIYSFSFFLFSLLSLYLLHVSVLSGKICLTSFDHSTTQLIKPVLSVLLLRLLSYPDLTSFLSARLSTVGSFFLSLLPSFSSLSPLCFLSLIVSFSVRWLF